MSCDIVCMKSSNISAKRFTQPARIISQKGGKSVLLRYTLWKYATCVKDVPTIYVNFITIVIIVSEKKNRGITFVPPFTHCWKTTVILQNIRMQELPILLHPYQQSPHPVNPLSHLRNDPPDKIFVLIFQLFAPHILVYISSQDSFSIFLYPSFIGEYRIRCTPLHILLHQPCICSMFCC
jgi:hypothetical protein